MSFDDRDKTRLHTLEYNSMWLTGMVIALTIIQLFTAACIARLAFYVVGD